MNAIELLPIEQLSISPLRKRGALPWPKPAAIGHAQRHGVTSLVVARKRELHTDVGPRYEILKGLSTWLLAQKAVIDRVPVMVLEDLSDRAAAAMANGEESTNPIATAELIDEYCFDHKASVAAAARYFGLSRTQASHHRRLLSLDPEVQKLVRSQQVSFRHAKLLVGLAKPKQVEMARRVVRDHLSTRDCEKLLGRKAAPTAPASNTGNTDKDADTRRLEQLLGEQLGTRVSIEYEPGGKGSLGIAFHDLDTLDGVLQRLGCSYQ